MLNPACRQAKNARDAVYFLALSVNSGLQRRSTVGSLSVTRRINGVQTATYDAECAYITRCVGREREGNPYMTSALKVEGSSKVPGYY